MTHATIGFASSLALACLLGSAGAAAKPGDVTVLKTFPAPHPSPDGIATDGEVLYVSDCASSVIKVISPDDGSVISQKTVSGHMLDHLAWDGSRMWINDHDGMSVIMQVDLAGKPQVVQKFDMPFANVMGVAWDGEKVWTMDAGGLGVYTMDPSTGETTYRFRTPGDNPCGIGWDGRCVWIGDLSTRRYYQIDPDTGDVQVSFVIPGGPTALPTGILWDGGHFWVVDEYPYAPKIIQVDVELPETGPCAKAALPDERPLEVPEPAPDPRTAEPEGIDVAVTSDVEVSLGEEPSEETSSRPDLGVTDKAGRLTDAATAALPDTHDDSHHAGGGGCTAATTSGLSRFDIASPVLAFLFVMAFLRWTRLRA